MNRTDGIPLAVFLTVMDIWATWQFGVPLWEAWGDNPLKRVGILVMAGTASASLCHAWAQILKIKHLQRNSMVVPVSGATECADV